jgi:hypothetical protein
MASVMGFRSVDGEEGVDIGLALASEELLHAAKISETFFSGICNEGDGACGLYFACVQCLRNANQSSETAAVVVDSWSLEHVPVARDVNVRAFRKDGVQMRGDHDMRARVGAGSVADEVSCGVRMYVLQVRCFEELSDCGGTLLS